MKMGDLAAETGAVVVGSPRGIHFANEVFNWHHVGELPGERVLPGLLITQTHPSYFGGLESMEDRPAELSDKMLVIPLASFCTTESEFIEAIEQIFQDLRDKKALTDFEIAPKNVLSGSAHKKTWMKAVDAIELKPGAFGATIDLKQLFGHLRS